MLQSTTTLIETATVVGTTGTTAKTAVKYEVDEKGNKTAVLVNKKKAALGTSLASTASSATYGYQQASFNQVINNVHNAQAYVESLDEDTLATLSEMLDARQLELEGIESKALGEVESKQPYVKK